MPSNFGTIVSQLGSELPRTLVRHTRKCDSQRWLEGKVIVITGGNSGIGKETAYWLSFRRPRIIIGARDLKKSEQAIKDIKKKNPSANVVARKLDLSSMLSIRQFANRIKEQEEKVDILINNAGIPLGPEQQTVDGFEMQFGAGYLGHFLLTLHLLPHLKKSPNARIISVATQVLFGNINFENINLRNGAYTPSKSYHQSKLALVLFTRELAKRLGPKSNVKTYALNPGNSYSKPGGNFMSNIIKKIFSLSVEAGAQTTLYCVLEESLDEETGCFYDNCRRVDRMVKQAKDDVTAEKLWKLSCDLVKLEDEFKLEIHQNGLH